MVISIIALLIAILLPALKAARESALAVTCGSNLRQSAMAMLIYASDNRDTVFEAVRPGGGAFNRYLASDYTLFPDGGLWHWPVMAGGYLPGRTPAANCPTEGENDTSAFAVFGSGFDIDEPDHEQHIVELLGPPDRNFYFRRLGSLQRPTNYLILVDSWTNGPGRQDGTPRSGKAAWHVLADGPAGRHYGGQPGVAVNAVAYDGHFVTADQQRLKQGGFYHAWYGGGGSYQWASFP